MLRYGPASLSLVKAGLLESHGVGPDRLGDPDLHQGHQGAGVHPSREQHADGDVGHQAAVDGPFHEFKRVLNHPGFVHGPSR